MHKAKLKELQAIRNNLSEECNNMEVDIHAMKNSELANKGERNSLESTILELKKEIAVKTEVQQHLLLKKRKAELGMCNMKSCIVTSEVGLLPH